MKEIMYCCIFLTMVSVNYTVSMPEEHRTQPFKVVRTWEGQTQSTPLWDLFQTIEDDPKSTPTLFADITTALQAIYKKNGCTDMRHMAVYHGRDRLDQYVCSSIGETMVKYHARKQARRLEEEKQKAASYYNW